MKEHGQMLNMTGFERPTMKTLCLAFFLIFVFYRSILSASTVGGTVPVINKVIEENDNNN